MGLSAERLALAPTAVFASEISALAGLYPATWKNRTTEDDILDQKLGRVAPFEGNAKTERGNWMEPIIAGRWSEQTGRPVRKNEVTVIHPLHTFVGATADYFTADDAGEIVECKYVGAFAAKNWKDGPPPWVLAQCQFQLGVLEKPRAHIAAFLEGCPLSAGVDTWTVNFDAALWTKLLFIAQRFMERVRQCRTEAA